MHLLLTGAALFAASAPAVACVPGAALPIRPYLDPNERCAAAGNIEQGRILVGEQAAQSNAQLRARLKGDIDAYDKQNFAVGAALNVLEVAEASPWGKALFAVPWTSGIYKVVKKNVADGIKERNEAKLHQSVRQIYAGYLAGQPDPMAPSASDAHADFIRYLGANLSWQNYGPAGKEVDALLIEEVGRMRGELEAVRLEVRQQLSQPRPATAPKPAPVVAGEQVDATAATKALRDELTGVLRDASARTAKDIEILLTFQERAARDHATLVSDVGAIRSTVEQQSRQIEANTAQIRANTADLRTLRDDLTRFSTLQEGTALLAADNAVRLDAVGAVLFDNVDARSQLQLVQSGALRMPDSKKREMVTALKDRIELEERVDTINKAAAGVQMGQQLLAIGVRAGLSPQDAKRGEQLLAIGEIGIGVARMTAGDFSGLIGVASGSATLFGGPPGPDPTQQLILQQFAIVNEKLERISGQVQSVSEQVAALSEWSVKAHRDTMQQLAEVEALGRSSQAKLEYLIKIAQESSPRECQVIGGSEADLYVANMQRVRGFSELRGLTEENGAPPSLQRCVDQFMLVANKYQLPFIHYRESSQTMLEDYRTLLSRPYSAGTLPAINRVTQCAAANLLDPLAVYLVGDTLLAVDPVLYLSRNTGLQPARVYNLAQHRARHQAAIKRMQQWEEAVDCTLAQQSIVTGGLIYGEPVLNALQAVMTGPGMPPPDRALFAKTILKGELPYVHVNLATRIVYAEFSETPSMFEALANLQNVCATDAAGSDAPMLKVLNDAIRRQRFTFETVKHVTGPGCSVAIKVATSVGGEPYLKLLNVAPASVVAADKMLYPDELDALLGLKVRLAQRRADYELSLGLLNKPDAQAFTDAMLIKGEVE